MLCWDESKQLSLSVPPFFLILSTMCLLFLNVLLFLIQLMQSFFHKSLLWACINFSWEKCYSSKQTLFPSLNCISLFTPKCLDPGEMDKSGKRSPHCCSDLSSDPSTHLKGEVWWVVPEVLVLASQSSLPRELQVPQEALSQKLKWIKWRAIEEAPTYATPQHTIWACIQTCNTHLQMHMFFWTSHSFPGTCLAL